MSDFLFYLNLGWEHIISLDAVDHQLFILVLVAVYFYEDWRKILILITAFTIGHSATLALSVLEVLTLPSTLVEVLIPVTILLTAVDNLLLRKNQEQLMKVNYLLALIFGLIHGLGFANIVRVAISSEQNIALPLLGFNVGLEMGQIVVVAVIMLVLCILIRFFNFKQKYWIVGVSLLAILISGQMIAERI